MNQENYHNTIKEHIKNHEQNSIFVASKLYSDRMQHIPELTFYKSLERLTKDETLVRLAKGVYSVPKATRFGKVKANEKQVIEHYTGLNGEYGLVIGYGLYSKYHLTTQMAKKTELYSNRLEAQQKRIGNVVVHRIEINMTPEVRRMIEALEILDHYGNIENMNYAAFYRYLKTIAQNYNEFAVRKVQHALRYKKRTIAFLAMILDSFKIEHDLQKMLSGTSRYKFPTMEEIYEAAQ